MDAENWEMYARTMLVASYFWQLWAEGIQGSLLNDLLT